MAELTDRDLVRLYWPAELRPAFDALFVIDDALADVVTRSTQPALGAIKLAWWRDRLEELDERKWAGEPRLRDAASELLPRGLKGRQLVRLTDGWEALLHERIDYDRVAEHGVILFELLATLLGQPAPQREFGLLFGSGRAARLGFVAGAAAPAAKFGEVPGSVRRITMLAALAARDLRSAPRLEPQGTPARAWSLLLHRLTGRI